VSCGSSDSSASRSARPSGRPASGSRRCGWGEDEDRGRRSGAAMRAGREDRGEATRQRPTAAGMAALGLVHVAAWFVGSRCAWLARKTRCVRVQVWLPGCLQYVCETPHRINPNRSARFRGLSGFARTIWRVHGRKGRGEDGCAPALGQGRQGGRCQWAGASR